MPVIDFDLAQGEYGKLTATRLREVLKYDLDTGNFVWIKPPKNHPRMSNKVAGSPSDGYLLIKIDGQKHKASRLAWLYVYGEWPALELDHKDRNRRNNAWINLRPATNAQNQANKLAHNKKGNPRGVRERNGRWDARINYGKQQIYLGAFSTAEDASAAYFDAAQKLYGEFARRE